MAYPTPYTSTIFVPLPSDEELRDLIGSNFAADKMLNVLKMMAGAGDMYGPTVGFINAIFQTSGVDPRIREMIMLRAAVVLNSPYEWQANVILARNVGLNQKEIEASASDGPVTGINPDYVLICKATDELSMTASLSDETLSALLVEYGDVVTRKLILIVGWFNLLSRFLNGCRVQLDSSDKIGHGTSPFS
jgi:alkylhydroperoxidase family enzyme